MTAGAAGGGAAAAAAAMANAIKASGAIVQLDPDEFQRVLWKVEEPLVVAATAKFFGTRYQYIFGYKGLVFYAKTKDPIRFSGKTEVITAGKIWVPNS